jgi:hypothetical protein
MAELKGEDDLSAGSMSTTTQSRQNFWASVGDSHPALTLLALQKYLVKTKKNILIKCPIRHSSHALKQIYASLHNHTCNMSNQSFALIIRRLNLLFPISN